jgi:hypothetical protein
MGAKTFLDYFPFLRKESWLMRDHHALCMCAQAHTCPNVSCVCLCPPILTFEPADSFHKILYGHYAI